MKHEIKEKGYLNNITATLVGSCTNSSYEDIARAASIAREADSMGLKAVVPFFISPGSESVYVTVKKAGFLDQLEKIGGVILANACGPCIGQWKRDDIKIGEKNTIVSSYNRNFPGRNDGNRETLSFLVSPEIVVAMALAGKLDFDPESDQLMTKDGQHISLSIPSGDVLPVCGLTMDMSGLVVPPKDASNIKVIIDKNSDRLALLEPFLPWDNKDFIDLPVLLKASGKCTTDHISQAGSWLKYRGHLDKIADNTYLGAINAFTETPGIGIDVFSVDKKELSLPILARAYKNNNISWAVIGDENFGEGSSREHAAMQPRHLGAKLIIVRSFARIHETNLKKHGILPLTFINPQDYDDIGPYDRISVTNLSQLSPSKEVKVSISHEDGTKKEIFCSHTMSETQISWFKAGSALNALIKSC
jgi:aconitate hydratase